MTVALIASEFRKRYPDALPGLGASLRLDVQSLGEWCRAAHEAIISGSIETHFSNDPMADIEAIAATLELVNAELHAQGFVPTRVDYLGDPVGMLSETAAYFAKVAPLVVDHVPTMH